MEHLQATCVSRGGLEDRGNVFFAAIAMTRMPMIITDPRQPDNPIVFANGAFLDLTGYPESQILGRNLRFLQGTNTNRDTVAEIRQGIDQQRAVAVDILNYKADGSPFWNDLYMGPVFDASGALLYYFASQLDITEKYNAYQSSIQSQKMEAIGALTAGLAHDFNNLLHIANGNLEMAKRQIHGSDAAVEALERSSNALEKATRLTQQLLTFARKQNLQPKTIALNQVALALTDMLAPTLAPAITMRLDLGTHMPPCQVAPSSLFFASNGSTNEIRHFARMRHQRQMARPQRHGLSTHLRCELVLYYRWQRLVILCNKVPRGLVMPRRVGYHIGE